MDEIELTEEQKKHAEKMAAILAEAVLGETLKLLGLMSSNVARLSQLSESFTASALAETLAKAQEINKNK